MGREPATQPSRPQMLWASGPKSFMERAPTAYPLEDDRRKSQGVRLDAGVLAEE